MGLPFIIAAGPRQGSFPSPTGLMTIFYDLRFQAPPGRVSQLQSQALGSLFVASYDSQGYNGGIRPRLHTGENRTEHTSTLCGQNAELC
jgi:hypothetical protein